MRKALTVATTWQEPWEACSGSSGGQLEPPGESMREKAIQEGDGNRLTSQPLRVQFNLFHAPTIDFTHTGAGGFLTNAQGGHMTRRRFRPLF